MKKLMLISNSIAYGRGYLGHCGDDIIGFLGSVKNIIFFPYAKKDYDQYAFIAIKRFCELGIKLESIHTKRDPIDAIDKASAIFIGGGNTFRLLNELYKKNLLKIIRKKVVAGMLYIGASAGSNVASPTIKTTNDMPIIEPPSFKALNLVPFQINPHYIDPDPSSKHMGETREQRIKEFHEENKIPVVGLREGTWLRIENKDIILKGIGWAKLFLRNKKTKEFGVGAKLNFLLE